ncbi:MAG: hypothetical protein AAFX78_04925 [Cyanobacteria bacterium J06638_20]
MPHGKFIMTGKNPAPGNRCYYCDRLLGNTRKVAKVVLYATPHPHGYYTKTKLLGYAHWVCPDAEPPDDQKV